ncbi:MAG: hypothetical protein ISR73_12170 [Gammaproteobacteria bacterium]|nr:hypothetical protein [Gammaproteobacteria bacterium]
MVMVIAGLMISLVPPLFSGAVSGARVKTSARDLAIVLREARSKAIIYNSEQQVQLDLEKFQYRVGKDKALALPDDVSVDIQLISGEKLNNIVKHVIHFFPDGSSSGELITLSGNNHVYHLQLNWLTGAISITSGLDHAG